MISILERCHSDIDKVMVSNRKYYKTKYMKCFFCKYFAKDKLKAYTGNTESFVFSCETRHCGL